MKEQLCKAFCSDLEVRSVRAGLAVRTPFAAADGDRIGFYVHRDRASGLYRLEDDGLMLPLLEASGASFETGPRAQAMRALLEEYGAAVDAETREFTVSGLSEHEVATAALRFVAFLLRVRDFFLITEARVVSTFREDVRKRLNEVVGSRAVIEENVAISPELEDFIPDFVLRSRERRPVAVFLGTSDARVLEALFVQMRVLYEAHEPCAVMALLEREKAINATVRRQAANRLTTVAYFRGDEIASVQRIAYEAIGQAGSLH